jgi:NDP-sugar pyrophosphorylase family protein
MNKFSAVILAAGYGKRMLPLTADTPKPLLPGLNNSLLLNQIKFLKKFTPNITVTIGFQKEKMLKALTLYGIDDFFFTKDKGNAFWLNKLKEDKIDSPIVVITSDNLMDIDLNTLIKEYYEKEEKSLIISTDSKEGTHDKLEINEKNEVLSMNYQKTVGKIASGLQVLNPKDLYSDKISFNDFHEVWSLLIDKKRLIVSELQPKNWISVDTVDDLNKFKNFVNQV